MRSRVFVTVIGLLASVAAWGGGMAREVRATEVTGTWTTVPGAKPPAISRRIGGMAAVSPTDVWAVGWSNVTRAGRAGFMEPLIEHWDGTAWATMGTPTPTDRGALLFAVAAVSPTDVWAVGGIAPDATIPDYARQPLTLHYDGSAWSQVSAPAVSDPTPRVFLSAVAAVGPNDVWAAGRDGAGGIVYHWNGTAWSRVGAPSAGVAVRDNLDWNGLSTVSARDVWLVGERQLGQSGRNGTQPVAAHWDGTAWTLVNTPLPAGMQNRLESVTARAPNDVWAVGSAGTPPDWPTAMPDTRLVPFVLHWDGVQWSEVSVPTPDANATVTSLTAASALAPDDVWVSGTFGVKAAVGDAITESAQTFFLHWNGTAWTIVPAPTASGGSGTPFESPAALAAGGPADLWCGGQFQSGAVSFLHYTA